MSVEYSATEQMVFCGAKEIKDGDVIYVGVGLPTLATWLAKLTHAPDCTVVHEVGIIRTRPCPLGFAMDSLPVQTNADMLTGFYGVNTMAANGCYNMGFIGAGQIDRYGNVNSTVVGDYHDPTHRWPGSGGANDVISFCRNVIVILHQSRKRFPEKVDFITSPGYLDGLPNQREDAGLTEGTGPSKVITNMGVYRFKQGEMVLESIHAGIGVTVQEIRKETGWELKVSPDCKVTQPPDPEYLRVLREKVDPNHIFMDGKPAVR